MKKIKYIFTWQEWWTLFRRTLRTLFWSLFYTLWAVVLLAVNLADRAVRTSVRAIRRSPVAAFVIALAVSAVIYMLSYASLKCRLTTAEHQRDSLIIKIDSIRVLNGDKVSYFRYQSYKSE